MKTEYEIKTEDKAEEFLENTSTELKVEFMGNRKYFSNDRKTRDVYKITLRRGKREYVFEFEQFIACSGQWLLWKYEKEYYNYKKIVPRYQTKRNKQFEIPSAYDILACLQKTEVGTFENFCSELGYDTDSITAKDIYTKVTEEYKELERLYNEREMIELREIE